MNSALFSSSAALHGIPSHLPALEESSSALDSLLPRGRSTILQLPHRSCLFYLGALASDPQLHEGDVFVPKSKRLRINISGLIFDISESLLDNHPETLMGSRVKRKKYYDQRLDEYYLHRNQACFEAIVEYYQSGKLRRPGSVPLKLFVTEVKFFELDADAVRQFCKTEGFEKPEPEAPPSHPILFKIWKFVTDPQSSIGAQVYALFSMLIVILSVVVFCLESLPYFHQSSFQHAFVHTNATGSSSSAEENNLRFKKYTKLLFVIEANCMAWFTMEFLLHLIASPKKRKFLLSALNIFDLIAIVPFYIHIIVDLTHLAGQESPEHNQISLAALHLLRLVRVFRILKLTQHSKGLRILGETFFMSSHELGLFVMVFGIATVVFSSAIYYAEHAFSEGEFPYQHFSSIPDSFYWTALTLTTAGYGVIVPQTILGKLIGGVCAFFGVIAAAGPGVIIVNNFTNIYQREKERHDIEEILAEVVH